MDAQELVAWRKGMAAKVGRRVTQQMAADSLGISKRAYQLREAGESPLARETELACRRLEEHPGEIILPAEG